MKYRVLIDEAFDNEADAQAVFRAAKERFGKAKSLSTEERKHINIHRCFHDETPARPCEPIEELTDGKVDRTSTLG